MTKRKTRREAQELFDRLLDVTGAKQPISPDAISDDVGFAASLDQARACW